MRLVLAPDVAECNIGTSFAVGNVQFGVSRVGAIHEASWKRGHDRRRTTTEFSMVMDVVLNVRQGELLGLLRANLEYGSSRCDDY